MFSKTLTALAIGVVLSASSAAHAAYSPLFKMAENVYCQTYETEKDVEDLRQLILGNIAKKDGDVLKDAKDFDGYDYVMYFKIADKHYESRWNDGLYCVKITPLSDKKTDKGESA